VCDLFETRRGFVDEAPGRYELVRGIEEVIGRTGLERIRAGEANVLGQFLVPRAEAGFRVEDIELTDPADKVLSGEPSSPAIAVPLQALNFRSLCSGQ
jgi:hypothetical protein